LLINDVAVRLQAESNETALSWRPEGMSERPELQEEAGLMKFVGRACPFTYPVKMSP